MAKSSAHRTITATDAHVHFGEMIKQVSGSQEPVVIDQDGIPVVVILSFDAYENLLRDANLTRFERLSRAAGLEAERQGLTEEQLEAEMEAIKQGQYQETYG